VRKGTQPDDVTGKGFKFAHLQTITYVSHGVLKWHKLSMMGVLNEGLGR
jgi:hypothetical protein